MFSYLLFYFWFKNMYGFLNVNTCAYGNPVSCSLADDLMPFVLHLLGRSSTALKPSQKAEL